MITLDLAESDAAHRERLRESMAEPYRTVLGHLRHEIGHYDAELLARDRSGRTATSARTPRCTRLEDFAEVFAHFLHLADTLQTAATFGLIPARVDLTRSPMAEVSRRPGCR